MFYPSNLSNHQQLHTVLFDEEEGEKHDEDIM